MKTLFTFLLIIMVASTHAQRKNHHQASSADQSIDSMYVNLYTDSLKKGTYNYINVDGKLKSGRFVPLDTSDVIFSASDGHFDGNSLWIDRDFRKEKVTIRVILKTDRRQDRTFDMYVKKAPDPELKTEQQILDDLRNHRSGKRGRRGE